MKREKTEIEEAIDICNDLSFNINPDHTGLIVREGNRNTQGYVGKHVLFESLITLEEETRYALIKGFRTLWVYDKRFYNL